MGLTRTTLITFTVVFITTVHSGKIPNGLPICKRNDPHVSKCVKTALNEAKPYLRRGIKEFKFPSIDEFPAPDINIGSDPFHIALTNMKVNLSSYQVTHVELDVKNLTGMVAAKFPTVLFSGHFDVNLPAGVLPYHIKAKGEFSSITRNIVVKVAAAGKLYNTDQGERGTLTHSNGNIDIDDINIQLTSDSGKPEILTYLTDLANQNVNLLFKIAKPFVEKIGAGVIMRVLNDYLKNIPVGEVFLNN